MHKAILINPNERTVTEVTINDWRTIRELVGGTISGVGYFTPELKMGGFKDDYGYVNDDGMFSLPDADFIHIPGYGQQVWRGNMVITGSDGEDGTADVKMNVEDVKNIVQFVPMHQIKAFVNAL